MEGKKGEIDSGLKTAIYIVLFVLLAIVAIAAANLIISGAFK